MSTENSDDLITVDDALKCLPPETVQELRYIASRDDLPPQYVTSALTLLPCGSRMGLQAMGVMTNLCELTAFGIGLMRQLQDSST